MTIKKFLFLAAAALLPVLATALKAWAEDAEDVQPLKSEENVNVD